MHSQMIMERDLEGQLLGGDTTMANCVVLMNEFYSEDWLWLM